MSDANDPQLNPFVTAVLGKKALDVVILNVGGLTSLADTFIICSGRSNRQVTAIAEYIRTTLKKEGLTPLSIVFTIWKASGPTRPVSAHRHWKNGIAGKPDRTRHSISPASQGRTSCPHHPPHRP